MRKKEAAPPMRPGRKAALALVIILPGLAIGVIVGSGLIGKHVDLTAAPSLTGLPLEEIDAGSPEEELDAGTLVDAQKKKPVKKKAKDAGS